MADVNNCSLIIIMEYDFILQHIDGTENTLPDALSRFGFQESSADNQFTSKSQCQPAEVNATDTTQTVPISNAQFVPDPSPQCWSESDIKELQGKDKDVSQVSTWFDNTTRIRRPTEMQSRSIKACFIELQAKKLIRHAGLVYQKFQLSQNNQVYYQIVVP